MSWRRCRRLWYLLLVPVGAVDELSESDSVFPIKVVFSDLGFWEGLRRHAACGHILGGVYACPYEFVV